MYARRAPSLELIGQFAQAFFLGCDVTILPMVDFNESMKNRINSQTKQIQYQTSGLLEYLVRARNQRDTEKEILCVAVTMADIYPDETYNFVYGRARATDSTGVYSFSRLDPLFPMPPYKSMNRELTDVDRIIILRRCIKILLHEICHLFGLKHCIYYLCLMNGANNEIEMDQQTLFVCPVCLRKLQSSLKFNIEHMYKKFADLCESHALNFERDWYRQRLDIISIQ
ncbi:unnamed protein product [Rotaria socialis]|uniref:Archaemetzincin-2 n=1 Tax=Rotaria socialis TaxID=392032 RepID=A0A821BY46_9BILA|nr:unnamed protein product [Rotaria socialis]